MVISGTSPDGGLVEFIELPASEHPFYVATQAHPEFRSRPARAHPLFARLVQAGLAYQTGKTADGAAYLDLGRESTTTNSEPAVDVAGLPIR